VSEQDGTGGRDLAAGATVGGVPDGGAITGRVGDDSVAVFRRGGELFALDAACTHYGGPLTEGLVDGETVRCPLHHARFAAEADRRAGLIRATRRKRASAARRNVSRAITTCWIWLVPS